MNVFLESWDIDVNVMVPMNNQSKLHRRGNVIFIDLFLYFPLNHKRFGDHTKYGECLTAYNCSLVIAGVYCFHLDGVDGIFSRKSADKTASISAKQSTTFFSTLS